MNSNLYSFFERAFPSDLNRALIHLPNGKVVSYASVHARAGQLANALKNTGIEQGDRVTVQVAKSVEALCLYLACLRGGYVYHPLNTAYTKAELEYFVANAEPRLIVCTPDRHSEFSELCATLNTDIELFQLDSDGLGDLADAADKEPAAFATAEKSGQDLAALLYSSGTTGRPKGIMLSHKNLSHSAQSLVEAWGFNQEDCLLHALPIYHVHGLFVAIGCTLLSGSSLRWHASYNAAEVLSDLQHCTVMMGVPTYYTRLLTQEALTPESCGRMRLFISGSAPLLSETFVDFEKRTGHQILERYGMTETNMNSSNPLEGRRKVGTVGPALPGVSLRIVNAQGKTLPEGEAGDLQVKGPNVFSAYWRMPEKTAEDFTEDGYFATGDIASIDEDGYLSIVGRAKDIIISGGLNIYPKEIEQVIDDIEWVNESAIIGLKDLDFGEAVTAVVVLQNLDHSKQNTEHLTAEIRRYCKNRLASFKTPKQVYFVDELPRNAMGKVQKNVLRQRYSSSESYSN